MPTPHDHPSYYILIASNLEFDPFTASQDIVRTLAGHGAWLGAEKFPYRHDYEPGDRVLLYAAGRGARSFLADAVVSGRQSEVTAADQAIANRLGLEGFVRRLPLRAVRLWQQPLPLKPLVPELNFITDKRNWGLWLRMAAIRIPAADYRCILKEAGLPEPE